MVISAKPIIGEKSVNLTKLSLWIEQKLVEEFHRFFVIPNMVEIMANVMIGNYTRKKARVKAKLNSEAHGSTTATT